MSLVHNTGGIIEERKRNAEILLQTNGGLRATSRLTGEVSEDGRSVSVETIRGGLRGHQKWSDATKAKLAAAWGVSVEEVLWPDERDEGASGMSPDLEAAVEMSVGNAGLADPTEVNVLLDFGLVEAGLERLMHEAMLYLGQGRTDQVYRRVFGRRPSWKGGEAGGGNVQE